MTRVRCFDVGVGRFGFEIQWLVKEIFPALNITDFQIYGFEAWSSAYTTALKELANLPNVTLLHLAIGSTEGKCNLYFANTPDGHSIFASKNNIVDVTKFEVVSCTRLSQWIKTNVPDFHDGGINILRFNVEGAEWPLFEDLDATDMLKDFHIICGNCGSDISSVKELMDADCRNKFNAIAKKHNTNMFWFCWDTRHDDQSKADMRRRLEALLKPNH